MPSMHICLDVDETITYAPAFFAALCDKFAEARVTIVTFRTDKTETERYLNSIGVRFNRVVVSTDPDHGKTADQSLYEWKANFVNRMRPDMFFEDMPEVVARVDPSILVFMPCDEVIRDWISCQLNVRNNK